MPIRGPDCVPFDNPRFERQPRPNRFANTGSISPVDLSRSIVVGRTAGIDATPPSMCVAAKVSIPPRVCENTLR